MYKNIIVPIDLSDKQSIKAIFPAAINLAKAFGSELHLVHIIPDFGTKLVEDYLPKNWINDQKAKYNKQLQDLVSLYILEDRIFWRVYHKMYIKRKFCIIPDLGDDRWAKS